MFNAKQKSVHISIDSTTLEGILSMPKNKAFGIILFAHGSGSSRHSPRNSFVAKQLNEAGFTTLLFDLLTEQEDETYETRFNIPLLSERLLQTTQWLKVQADLKDLRVGYFGASTGAAAAIEAATDPNMNIAAVVSRGGRPDMAEGYLEKLKSPTLLIVGGDDEAVIGMNESAFEKMSCEKKLEIIPGATHLFEEPGKLEIVSDLAINWFNKFLK